MYTILINDDNTLVTSVKERIMQRSKLVDSLHFLVNEVYNDFNMSDFTAYMEYILPVSKEYKSEVLELSENSYKGKLEYKLPFDTNLTSEAGNIEVQVTFIKVDLDENGNGKQYVRKTSPTVITIVPISAWSDIVPDEALNAIDQRLLKADAQIKALSESSNLFAITKADDIVLDSETKEIYLTAKGNQIGNKVSLNDLGNEIVNSAEESLVTMII